MVKRLPSTIPKKLLTLTKAIIFDLNGVFVQSPRLSDRFHDELGVPVEEFLSALKEVMAKVRMPEAGSAYTHWKPYLNKWGVSLSEEEFFDFWFNVEREVPEMIELTRGLKKRGIKLFILSNNLAERTEYYNKNFPFLQELFDKVYYSWQTGFIKPSKEAYELVLSENKLKPEECIYFDDSESNVKVAGSLGIRSFLFKNAETVREMVG